MKIRVFDKIRSRYGTLLDLSLFHGNLLYGIYDEEGDPVEIEPTILKMEDAQLEFEINGAWVPVVLEAV